MKLQFRSPFYCVRDYYIKNNFISLVHMKRTTTTAVHELVLELPPKVLFAKYCAIKSVGDYWLGDI